MELKECKEKLNLLEEKISLLVRSFEDDTGVSVTGILVIDNYSNTKNSGNHQHRPSNKTVKVKGSIEG